MTASDTPTAGASVPERSAFERLVNALMPFEQDWGDAGMPDSVADDKLMLDADGVGGEIITVGHWRELMVALSEARSQMWFNRGGFVGPTLSARLASPATPAARGEEPFGYWVEQKHADPVLLRKPAYIPEPSVLRTVTPLFAAPTLPPVGGAPLPDIGERPPLEGDGKADERLHRAYRVQQTGVPDQTALVWRADLLDLYHRHWTLEGLATLAQPRAAEAHERAHNGGYSLAEEGNGSITPPGQPETRDRGAVEDLRKKAEALMAVRREIADLPDPMMQSPTGLAGKRNRVQHALMEAALAFALATPGLPAAEQEGGGVVIGL